MIAHITGQDAVTFAALASLPFAAAILWRRWDESPRRQSDKYWRSIASIANEVSDEVDYALSRERHPAGKKLHKN